MQSLKKIKKNLLESVYSDVISALNDCGRVTISPSEGHIMD